MRKPLLHPWQQTLIVRLERGLGRKLVPADLECVVWGAASETLTVAARPLLGELRANNVTSNVFRTWETRRGGGH